MTTKCVFEMCRNLERNLNEIDLHDFDLYFVVMFLNRIHRLLGFAILFLFLNIVACDCDYIYPQLGEHTEKAQGVQSRQTQGKAMKTLRRFRKS